MRDQALDADRCTRVVECSAIFTEREEATFAAGKHQGVGISGQFRLQQLPDRFRNRHLAGLASSWWSTRRCPDRVTAVDDDLAVSTRSPTCRRRNATASLVHRGPFRAHRAIRRLDTFVPPVVDTRSIRAVTPRRHRRNP